VLFDEVVACLTTSGTLPLPGAAAQAAMAPRPRAFWIPGVVPDGMRVAAGLALLYPRDGETMLLLTLRAARLAKHRGQLSFPGGAVEPGETVEEAALREAEEEVGLARSAVVLRLRLTPLHIPVSRFVLNTVVGTATSPPTVRPCAAEVDRIVEIGLSALASGATIASETREGVDGAVEVPYFDVDGVRLWGATAMVVAELLAVLGRPVDPWADRQRRP
jgi:8-oxo-dGTP pyrophosphatase MutT (NUDIX family)